MEPYAHDEDKSKDRSDEEEAAIASAIREIREQRQGVSLAGLKIRDLINEGRRDSD